MFPYTGKVHGSLARAGKVRGQTPKVPKQEKKKKPTGRAMKRVKYTRRFLNVGESKTRWSSGGISSHAKIASFSPLSQLLDSERRDPTSSPSKWQGCIILEGGRSGELDVTKMKNHDTARSHRLHIQAIFISCSSCQLHIFDAKGYRCAVFLTHVIPHCEAAWDYLADWGA